MKELIKTVKKEITKYQETVFINFFGERDGYMFFGSFYGLFFYSCGMLCVAVYSLFLYNGI